MCFRPTEAAATRTCPECEGTVKAVGGFLPPKCPYCGHVFTEDAPAASSTPKAPAAPKVPVAPKAPAVPKAPAAPPASRKE